MHNLPLLHMYVCIQQSMDQPGKFANLARRQLNTENQYFPFPVRAREFGLRDEFGAVPSRVSLLIFHTQTESGSLQAIFLSISAAVSLCLNRHTISSQSRSSRVTQLRTDGVHCRESAGTWPIVPKVVPVTGAVLAGHQRPVNMHLSFPTPIIGIKWAC